MMSRSTVESGNCPSRADFKSFHCTESCMPVLSVGHAPYRASRSLCLRIMSRTKQQSKQSTGIIPQWRYRDFSFSGYTSRLWTMSVLLLYNPMNGTLTVCVRLSISALLTFHWPIPKLYTLRQDIHKPLPPHQGASTKVGLL